MSAMARHIDWEFMDGAKSLGAGDLVSAAAGGLPIYRVVNLEGGRAHLRDIDTGADQVTPLSLFHWKAAGRR
jgi:hypothetical protein